MADKRDVFVIAPIGAVDSDIRKRSDGVLRHIVKKSLGDGFNVVRADEEDAPDSITPRMIKRIQESYLIVVDITGDNPNVFYEMALAHGYRKPIIYLCEGDTRPPFDIKDLRIISYNLADPDNLDEARDRFARYLKHIEANPNDQHNPVADADAFFTIREASTTQDQNSVLADVLEDITSDMRRIRSELGYIRDRIDESPFEPDSRLRRLPLAAIMERLLSRIPPGMADEMSRAWHEYRIADPEDSLPSARNLFHTLDSMSHGAPADLRQYFEAASSKLASQVSRRGGTLKLAE